jgi:hypothetical protein
MYEDTCQFFKACDVDFHQFLNGSWIDVLSQSLDIKEVSSTIRNELYETKNSLFFKKKVIKSYETKRCLTPFNKRNDSLLPKYTIFYHLVYMAK